jgi:cell division protein FtsI (penicillin-binding protein 3)
MSRKQKSNRKQLPIPLCTGRYFLLLGVLLCLFAGLVARAAYLQVYNKAFYIGQGDSRTIRNREIQNFRGNILDRNGVELAITVPVDSVWVNPSLLVEQDIETQLFSSSKWKKFAAFNHLNVNELTEKVKDAAILPNGTKGQYLFINRHVEPVTAKMVAGLDIDGVNLEVESKRYYPMAETSAHIIGYTDIDEQGIDGAEYIYNEWLDKQNGKSQEVRDLFGKVIEVTDKKTLGRKGKDLQLSIDSRIQAIAYKELKNAVTKYNADTGALVILDVNTSEVLAIANQPSYNPNVTSERVASSTRNRAFTDMFEPGSTVKPITIVSALEAGKFKPDTVVNTGNGLMKIGGSWVRDPVGYGKLDIKGVIKKSSNVGIAKIALALSTEEFLKGFYALGFGTDTGTGYPGEELGRIRVRQQWSKFEKAAMSFGYQISVTPIQLAQAYAIIGSGGVKYPLSILKRDTQPFGERVIQESTARDVMRMMEAVVSTGGTGTKANIKGYRVSGKTGTVKKVTSGRYGNQYVAVFAGIAPVENPKIAMVVFIDNPKGEVYYGGDAAAPVFGKTMYAALRTLNVLPDKVDLEFALSSDVFSKKNEHSKLRSESNIFADVAFGGLNENL